MRVPKYLWTSCGVTPACSATRSTVHALTPWRSTVDLAMSSSCLGDHQGRGAGVRT